MYIHEQIQVVGRLNVQCETPISLVLAMMHYEQWLVQCGSSAGCCYVCMKQGHFKHIITN